MNYCVSRCEYLPSQEEKWNWQSSYINMYKCISAYPCLVLFRNQLIMCKAMLNICERYPKYIYIYISVTFIENPPKFPTKVKFTTRVQLRHSWVIAKNPPFCTLYIVFCRIFKGETCRECNWEGPMWNVENLKICQAGKMVKGDRKSHLTVKLASVYGSSETVGWVGSWHGVRCELG